MSRTERIPTLHELKLAGRVERAKALFGPGGYLDPPTATRIRDARLCASNARSVHAAAVAEGVAQGQRGVTEAVGESDEGKDGNLARKSAPEASTITCAEGLEGNAVDKDGPKDGSPLSLREGPTLLDDTQAPQPPPPTQTRQPQDVSTRGGDGCDKGVPSLDAEPPSFEIQMLKSSPGPTPSAQKSLGAGLTLVTLKIVDGRPGGRGFTNLEKSGKVRHVNFSGRALLAVVRANIPD